MGEEFYCVLKLVSGEEIFSLIMVDENEGDPIIILQNPVIMKAFQNHQGMHLKVKPWIETSTNDLYMIKLDKVITMTESKDEHLISIYENYIQDEDDDSIEVHHPGGRVKPSSKMGYVGSVEDARKSLERIFKDLKES
jgi:hypothetical protein